ncbi:MAG: response regulator [Candidatus Thermoplasmatota archaeon]
MPTIMIVDDEKNVIDQMKFFLQTESFEVLTAETPREALEYMDRNSENKVDLILVNTFIPGTEQKAYFSLKPSSRFNTASNDDILPKPFTKDQLLSYLWKKI